MIPFNKPYVPKASIQYALEALESNHQQGDGPFTAKASKMVSDLVGGGHVLLTPSCTHALEMASMLANIGPGDEVILPSFTFTSAATAIAKFGATPVFVDIEMETKGIDVNQVREAISPRTKAISWVNYAGVAPDIAGLQSLADEFNLILIEDNAHGLGGSYKGKPLGSFGDFATQSFHATKNIQCGEGGALIINNSKYIDRAEIIREKGTDRSQFVRGEVQKYQWVDQGSSYLIAEALAAILLGQLENFNVIQTDRKQISQSYSTMNLADLCYASSQQAQEAAHMFYLEFKEVSHCQMYIDLMQAQEISVARHYQTLHNSRFGAKYLSKGLSKINSNKVSNSLIRIPLWYGMQKLDINQVKLSSDKALKTINESR
jgi:dTDP-4-amino-4,6-dideoxygalactose transaminase